MHDVTEDLLATFKEQDVPVRLRTQLLGTHHDKEYGHVAPQEPPALAKVHGGAGPWSSLSKEHSVKDRDSKFSDLPPTSPVKSDGLGPAALAAIATFDAELDTRFVPRRSTGSLMQRSGPLTLAATVAVHGGAAFAHVSEVVAQLHSVHSGRRSLRMSLGARSAPSHRSGGVSPSNSHG